MRFDGTFEELKEIITDHNIQGDWSVKNGQHILRTANGAVINWWPDSNKKTITFQGKPMPLRELEEKLEGVFCHKVPVF